METENPEKVEEGSSLNVAPSISEQVTTNPTMRQVSLDDAENLINDDVFYSVTEQVELGELEMRKKASEDITNIFIKANTFVLGFLAALVAADWVIIISTGKVEYRLVDKEIIMMLLGATTVQLGIIMVSMSRFLFPSKPYK